MLSSQLLYRLITAIPILALVTNPDSPIFGRPGNDTVDALLHIDPAFSYQINYKENNPIDSLSTNLLALSTTIQLSRDDLSRPITPRIWYLPDHQDVKFEAQPLSIDPLEARVVTYGLFQAILNLAQRPRFTECGVLLFMNDVNVGVIYLESRVGNSLQRYANRTDEINNKRSDVDFHGTKSQVSASQAQPQLVVLPSLTSPVQMDRLSVNYGWLSTTRLSQNRVFLGLLSGVIGLAGLSVFSPGSTINMRNAEGRVNVEITPPAPVRRSAPFNSIEESIRVLGRIPLYCIDENQWREVKAIAFWDGVWISSTTVKDWNPPANEES